MKIYVKLFFFYVFVNFIFVTEEKIEMSSPSSSAGSGASSHPERLTPGEIERLKDAAHQLAHRVLQAVAVRIHKRIQSGSLIPAPCARDPSIMPQEHSSPVPYSTITDICKEFITKFNAKTATLNDVENTCNALNAFIINTTIAIGKSLRASASFITMHVAFLHATNYNARILHARMYMYRQRVENPSLTTWKTLSAEPFNDELCFNAAVSNVEYM